MSFPVAAIWTNAEGLSAGNQFLIQGFVHTYANRFAVNFLCANGDIAFHFNPRFDRIQPVVVCNTQMKSKKGFWTYCKSDEDFWGEEEIASSTPFKQNNYFEMTINVERGCYQVYVNGNRFLEFKHRLPLKTIQTLEIKGAVSVNHFEFFETKVPPTYSPPDSCDITHDKALPTYSPPDSCDITHDNVPPTYSPPDSCDITPDNAPPTYSPPGSCDITHDKVYVNESRFLEKPCLSSKRILTLEIKGSVNCCEFSETKLE